ncbi:MAG: hypothetical protein JNN25_13805 [Candidatus Kapabacteria bacterium]|nr:hypothetical protein [Candidatus Kapabacteria bacterium]
MKRFVPMNKALALVSRRKCSDKNTIIVCNLSAYACTARSGITTVTSVPAAAPVSS